MELESRQTQVVQEASMLANVPEASPVVAVTESDLRSGRGGCFSSGSRGRGFHPRIQCQICSQFGQLAQRCFYRFNRDYGGQSEPSPVRFSGQSLPSNFAS
ncbi:hypothetical protein V6Z11_D05G163100 [Gossypium hirsutum]